MELTDNLLWLLKQASSTSLTTVNDQVKPHGCPPRTSGCCASSTSEPGGCPAPSWPAGRRPLYAAGVIGLLRAAWWSVARILVHAPPGFCTPT